MADKEVVLDTLTVEEVDPEAPADTDAVTEADIVLEMLTVDEVDAVAPAVTDAV